MYKNLNKILLVILVVIQFTCKSDNQNKEKQKRVNGISADIQKSEQTLFANIQFASKRDTTCGMPLSAGLTDTVHLTNKIYGFCSKECKDDFISKLKTEKKR